MKYLALPLAAVTAATIACPVAAAQSQSHARGVKLHVQELGTLTVTGSQLESLEEIKQALHRVHSTSAADADMLVCNFSVLPGSRVNKTLTCETNRQWWRRSEIEAVNMATSLSAGRAGNRLTPGKQLTIALQHLRARNMAFALPVKYDAFKALMRALPTAAPASESDKD